MQSVGRLARIEENCHEIKITFSRTVNRNVRRDNVGAGKQSARDRRKRE
jgi:hypothetical protein